MNAPMNDEKWLDFYKENGYAVAEGVLGGGELKDYLALAEEISASQEQKYAPVINPDRHWSVFRRLLCHPALVQGLEILQGCRISALQSMLYFKPPGSLGRDMHQDNFYARAQYGAYIGTWIPLEDTDRENGGLVVYPGSHREPVQEIVEDPERRKTNTGDFINDRGLSCVIPPGYGKVYLGVPAGACVFIHGNLIHGSEENLSRTRFRRVFAGHYIKENAPFEPGRHAKREVLDVHRYLSQPES